MLYDHQAFLAVTLSGQLLLLDLVERLVAVGGAFCVSTPMACALRPQSDREDWHGVLSDWQTDTGMSLETTEVEVLVVEATNNFATRYRGGKIKRRGTLGGDISWKNVPNSLVVADAVLAALLDGVLPEQSVRRCVDPAVREHHPPGRERPGS